MHHGDDTSPDGRSSSPSRPAMSWVWRACWWQPCWWRSRSWPRGSSPAASRSASSQGT